MEEPKISRYDKLKQVLSDYSIGARAKHLGIAAVCGALSWGSLYLSEEAIRQEKEINRRVENLKTTRTNIEEVVISDNVTSKDISDISLKIIESKITKTYYLADQLNLVHQLYTPGNKLEQNTVKRELLNVKSALERIDGSSDGLESLEVFSFIASIGLGLASLRKLYRFTFKPN